MLKKILSTFASFFLFFAFTPTKISAQQDFFVDAKVEYRVEESGLTSVVNAITIENATAELYAGSYTLNLQSIDAKNTKAFEEGKELMVREKKEDDSITLTTNFENPAVGKGNRKTFIIRYGVDSFASRTGEVWEISIPRLSDPNAFRSYSVILSIPFSFGEEAYISPTASSTAKSNKHKLYFFEKEDIKEVGISAGFGEFQVFSFTLNYHLENPLAKSASTEIAIPPDTSYQKLYYQKIEPAPESMLVDADGNWLVGYTLKPRQRIDVNVVGSVQILASPRPYPSPNKEILEDNLAGTEYWQTEDQLIKTLAGKLGTPSAIYEYVTKNLKYDYERVRPNVVRKGAKRALLTPESAICMEFTDTFIALTRAAGIPAREINGYAYTENPEIQPLSLVADVLHSWAEYWDAGRGTWVPVDPTWGSTSKVDYFEKLDLRHFTFVIHGVDPTTPYPPGSYKLGPNPQKDVFVNFGYLPIVRKSQPDVITINKKTLPFAGKALLIKIKNPGPTAFYRLTPKILFDGKIVETGFSQVLPPYATYTIEVNIPFSFLGLKAPSEIKIQAQGKEVFLPSPKIQSIIYNLIFLSLLLTFVTLFVLVKTGKIKVKLNLSKLANEYQPKKLIEEAFRKKKS